jgi:hypothetical protein
MKKELLNFDSGLLGDVYLFFLCIKIFKFNYKELIFCFVLNFFS